MCAKYKLKLTNRRAWHIVYRCRSSFTAKQPLEQMGLVLKCKCNVHNGMVQQGLTSPSTHYRSFRRRFYGSYERLTQPTVSQHRRIMVSQPGSGPTRPKSPCYNNTLRQPPLRKSVKWTQSDKGQSDSPVNHSRECATIECYTLLQ